MARLEDPRGGRLPVLPHHLIGHSRAMHTVLEAADVSAQHAAISWDGQRWTLRDLASRNGTWLDGRRLGPGAVAPLAVGALIELGRPGERMVFVEDAAPAPSASAGALFLEGLDDLLAIPSPEDPVVVIVYDPDEGWFLSQGGTSRPLRSGAEVLVADRRWLLSRPEAVAATAEARAHHYLPLTLARAQIEDAGEPASGQGWLYAADLIRMLRQSANQLYMSLHRARRELEAIGLPEGVEFVERRSTTRQIRLAVSTLRVETL